MLRSLSCTFAAAALLLGCATEPVALKEGVLQELQAVDAVLLVPKEHTDVSVTATNIGGGLLDQLLAAYIDKKRQESAATAATPIVSELQAYDFRGALRSAWVREFEALSPARFRVPPGIDATPAGTDAGAARRPWFERSDAGAVLFADIDHTLQSGALLITARVEIYPKAAALMKYRPRPADAQPLDDGNAIYRNTFQFKREFVTATNVRRALDEGVADIAHRIAVDLGARKP
jgi:hypothetical protein